MILFPRIGAGSSCPSEQEILSPSFCLPKLYCFSYLQPNSLTPVSCPASDVSEFAASAYSQPPMEWYISHPHPFTIPPNHLPTVALCRACWIQAAVKLQPTSQGPLEKPRPGGREESATHPTASSFKGSPPAAPGWHPPRSLLGRREPRTASWALSGLRGQGRGLVVERSGPSPELSSSLRIFSFTRSSHWRRICTASSMGQLSRRMLSMASSLSPGSRVPVLQEQGGDRKEPGTRRPRAHPRGPAPCPARGSPTCAPRCLS